MSASPEVGQGVEAALALATLTLNPLQLQPVDGIVDLHDYSRFKYGSTAPALLYGHALAQAVAPHLAGCERVFLTASGYHVAPPAASFLLPPLQQRLHVLLPTLEVHSLQVDRSNVTDGDYAQLSQAERSLALPAAALRVPPTCNLRGALVVSVDDVRVSGVHQRAMDTALRAAGAREVLHCFVIDAFAAREHPEIEAELNSSAVRTLADLIAVTREPQFAPNSRLCKRVLQLEPTDLRRFVDETARDLPAWIREVAVLDGLDQVSAYRDGVKRLTDLLTRS